jgi:hypothetical protein
LADEEEEMKKIRVKEEAPVKVVEAAAQTYRDNLAESARKILRSGSSIGSLLGARK